MGNDGAALAFVGGAALLFFLFTRQDESTPAGSGVGGGGGGGSGDFSPFSTDPFLDGDIPLSEDGAGPIVFQFEAPALETGIHDLNRRVEELNRNLGGGGGDSTSRTFLGEFKSELFSPFNAAFATTIVGLGAAGVAGRKIFQHVQGRGATPSARSAVQGGGQARAPARVTPQAQKARGPQFGRAISTAGRSRSVVRGAGRVLGPVGIAFGVASEAADVVRETRRAGPLGGAFQFATATASNVVPGGGFVREAARPIQDLLALRSRSGSRELRPVKPPLPDVAGPSSILEATPSERTALRGDTVQRVTTRKAPLFAPFLKTSRAIASSDASSEQKKAALRALKQRFA